MKDAHAWIPYLMMAAICHAGEIVAWRVPLTHYAYRGLESDGVIRCKVPPEASPFFKPGDELWDLKGIPSDQMNGDQRLDTDPSLEWVIWNAGSGRLVTKGEWSCIWQLYGRLNIDQLPRLCRLTADVFTVPADGSPLSNKSTPATSLSWICRSGRKFTAAVDEALGSIDVEGSVNLDALSSVADLHLSAAFDLPGRRRVEFLTSAALQPGKPLWLARDSTGTTGMDFRISSRIELPDGTPTEEVLLIQKANGAEPIKFDRSETRRFEIKGKGWLVTQWMEPSGLQGLTCESLPDHDPFAEPGPPGLMREQLKLKEVEVPAHLKPWFGRKVWDLRAAMQAAAVLENSPTAFAGYDPEMQRVFLYSELPENLDRFEQLFSAGCFRTPIHVIVTLDGKGQSRLLCRSGQEAHLSQSNDAGKVVRSMEIEPTIGEDGNLVDLKIDYQENSDSSSVQSINTCVTLNTGTALEILAGKSTEAEACPPLRVKAEIQGAID